MRDGYAIGDDTPAARQDGGSICPFCGSLAVVSWGDVTDDPMRIELYCVNEACEVREMQIIATRAGGHELERADVLALHTLEEGTPDERSRLGYDRRTTSGSDFAKQWEDDARTGGSLNKRTRPATVTVTTHTSWKNAHRARFGEPPLDIVQ
jgi:hypothetical protein